MDVLPMVLYWMIGIDKQGRAQSGEATGWAVAASIHSSL